MSLQERLFEPIERIVITTCIFLNQFIWIGLLFIGIHILLVSIQKTEIPKKILWTNLVLNFLIAGGVGILLRGVI